MIDNQTYTVLSLQAHMFHSRQMKEHAIFIASSLPSVEKLLAMEAEEYKKKFENLLAWALRNGTNIVTPAILQSQELVTDWTLDSEEKTQRYTGIAIDTSITKAAQNLQSGVNPRITQPLVEQIKFINEATIRLLDSFINYQEDMINAILSCNKFSSMYVTMIRHITDEAKWYRSELIDLEHGINIEQKDQKAMELFWTQIMRDHAWFIRGLLDPSQPAEIEIANNFAKAFNQLLDRLQASNNNLLAITNDVRLHTKELKEFKQTATKAIDECKLRSIILPLLADHVLREANHFLRLLQQVS